MTVRDVKAASVYPPAERSRCSKTTWDPTSGWSSARDWLVSGWVVGDPPDSYLVIMDGLKYRLLVVSNSWWFGGRESPRCSAQVIEGSSCACSMDGHARRGTSVTVEENAVRSVNGTCWVTFSARSSSWRKGEDLDSMRNHHQYPTSHELRSATSLLIISSYLHW